MACICPQCGTLGYSVGKVCSRTGETICIDCCRSCEYYFFNEAYVSHGCRYGVENLHSAPSKDEVKINQIRARIEEKYKKVEYFYQTDRPYIARKIECEINGLKMEMARLERR